MSLHWGFISLFLSRYPSLLLSLQMHAPHDQHITRIYRFKLLYSCGSKLSVCLTLTENHHGNHSNNAIFGKENGVFLINSRNICPRIFLWLFPGGLWNRNRIPTRHSCNVLKLFNCFIGMQIALKSAMNGKYSDFKRSNEILNTNTAIVAVGRIKNAYC